jgi:hypothetical protein
MQYAEAQPLFSEVRTIRKAHEMFDALQSAQLAMTNSRLECSNPVIESLAS